MRTRIITSYVVLLAFSAIVSSCVLTEILLLRLGDRIEADLDQEILELERLLADGRDPTRVSRSRRCRRCTTCTSPATCRAAARECSPSLG
ncbi:MAG: hypothetical protein ACRDVO_07470 [Jiangellaceae bacterium]